MQQRTVTHRAQKLFRKRRRQAERISELAEDQLERNLVRRFGRLYAVRRFIFVWVALGLAMIGCVVVQARALGGYYQTLQPAPGGIYREGILGNFTNANPLYATGQVNDAVSKLLFASLFKYDDKNNLIGDLAQSYSLDPAGTTYTVTLRPDLKWQDDQPLTAEDVVFTYQTIQNPDAESPLNVSWQNVTVSAASKQTIIFKLPNPLSSFPHSLTNGIIPKHILQSVNLTSLRSAAFNTANPIGAGPFRLKTIEVTGNSPNNRYEEIELSPFSDYHAGPPAIASFIIHTYPDSSQLLNGFRRHDISAMVGVQELPRDLANDTTVRTSTMPLTAANMVFFKTSEGVLSDKVVRQALVGGVDVDAITEGLRKPVLPVREPFLLSTPGYDPAMRQLSSGEVAANQLLDSNGWARQANGIRSKNGQLLTFKLYAQDTAEYTQVVNRLKERWDKLGVDTQVYLQADADVSSTAASHSYDALLYGISLGVDPDEFVYWHSSQADVRSPSRLNLSEWKSPVADSSLEDGRTRSDPVLRAIKYRPFLAAWQQDAPALGLYQPQFLYVTRGQVNGVVDRTVNSDTDRFNNVEQWMVRWVPKAVN
jgi:peptide/nickel transport system substrate-binding protein